MSKRLRFIDVYRGLAILLMLHGHTADALLNPDEKMSLAFQIYTIFRGFTAPMFLFISGFAFSITTLKHIDEYTRFSQKFLKRLRKFLFIVLLGYFLHLPYLSLKKLINETNFETLAQLFSSDVLQVIGVSLLSMQIALFFIKDKEKFAKLLFLLGIISFLISPFLFTVDFSKFLPLFIAQYLNTFHGSKFPLFPWIGYILIGAYIGYKFMIESSRGNADAFFKKIFNFAILSFPVLFASEYIFEILLNPNQFIIYSSPFLQSSRLAFVIVVFYMIWKIEKIVKLKVHPLQIYGMESLFAYVFHLMVVYGSPINPFHSFYSLLGGMLSYVHVFGIFILLALVVFAFSYALNFLKKTKNQTFDYFKYAAVSIILLVFFINPH
jgi:uncharacterized membrane protein